MLVAEDTQNATEEMLRVVVRVEPDQVGAQEAL
jgi:hypothetical protein